jgi:archaellum component FlaC
MIMTEPQVWVVVVGFTAAIATMITVTLTAFNRQLTGIRNEMAVGFEGMQKSMEYRVDAVHHRFEAVDARLDLMQTMMDVRFDGVDKRLDGVDKRLDRLEKKADEIDGDVTGLSRRVMGE